VQINTIAPKMRLANKTVNFIANYPVIFTQFPKSITFVTLLSIITSKCILGVDYSYSTPPSLIKGRGSGGWVVRQSRLFLFYKGNKGVYNLKPLI
jgi:hypothetical protein